MKKQILKGLDIKGKIPLNLIISINWGERALQEVVANSKARISILLPDVVIGNMLSNVLLLAADGIPPTYMFKHFGTAVREMRAYQKSRWEKDKLEVEIRARQATGKSTQNLEGRLALINSQMENSPVHQMVEEGMFQTIVEDIDPEVFKSTGPISELVEKGKEKFAERTGKSEIVDDTLTVAKELLMMPGSRTFQFAVMANQYTDFMGRYVKFKYDTEVRKKPKQQAIDDSMDFFIYYDEPTDPLLQAANDYGFANFTKFFFRIQRVGAKLWTEKPANMMMIAGMQAMTGTDVDDINDYFLNIPKLGNRIVAPWSHLGQYNMNPGDLFGSPIFDWVTPWNWDLL